MDKKKPNKSKKGILYIVAMPIGNREDITLRALNVLAGVDYIAAEDTRTTGRFLSSHNIKGNFISYFEHNEKERAPKLISKLLSGASIAVVSSAGTPSVSDPGFRVVKEAVSSGIKVVPIPGVSAALTALCVSGLPTDSYLFVGFLPRKKGKRLEQLKKHSDYTGTIIFYESPRRILSLISDIIQVMGDRRAVLSREMTKIHEEFIRGHLSEIHEVIYERRGIKGECTLLIHGRIKNIEIPMDNILEELRINLSKGDASLSRVVKKIANHYNISKSIVYNAAVKMKEND